MKKFFAVLAALFVFLSTCCAPPPAPATKPAVTHSADVSTVRVWRDLEVTLHVDTGFNEEGRAAIEAAAKSIRRLTHDRARVNVVFDLDFDSTTNLQEHAAAHDNLVIAVLSTFDVTKAIDAALKGPGTVMAATVEMKDGSTVVFLILDRIGRAEFENVVTHEFGHVIGLPDLEAFGAVMSGRQVKGLPPPADWTPADVELCRSFRFCD